MKLRQDILLKVGELAKRTDLTVCILHYYDAIGLPRPSARSDSGYRLYNRSDVECLYRIQAPRPLVPLPLSDVVMLLDGEARDLQSVIDEQVMVLNPTTSMQEAAQVRKRVVTDLRIALHDKQFRVYYQFIIGLTSGRICKVEALIRWQHPVRGLISPADLIPVAEETGMIVESGEWMFRQAARQAGAWRIRHNLAFQISVNASPVQL